MQSIAAAEILKWNGQVINSISGQQVFASSGFKRGIFQDKLYSLTIPIKINTEQGKEG